MINTQIDYRDFTNSIEMILQEFIESHMDSYVAFDYKSVQKGFERMKAGQWDNKPVIHISENTPNQAPVTIVTNEDEIGRKTYLSFNVYVVVSEITDNRYPKIKFLLNRLSDELKYIFDHYRSEFSMFNNVNMSLAESQFDGNPDNLYANRHSLTFDVIKKV